MSHTPFEARLLGLPPEADGARARASEILVRAERDLMLAWLQRIRTVEPYASRGDLSTREFLNTLPRMLNALILLLRQRQPPAIRTQDEDARGRIRTHALLRREQGVGPDAVVREYQVLREVVTDRLRRDMAAADLLEAPSEVHALLDEAVRITVADFH